MMADEPFYAPDHTLTFVGTKITCSVLQVPEVAPALQTWRTHFAGLKGESELRGKSGARQLVIAVIVHDKFKTRDALVEFIDKKLNGTLHGEHGELVYESKPRKFKRTWKHCTFEGFSAVGELLPDVAGTIDGGWFASGSLNFRQLRVE